MKKVSLYISFGILITLSACNKYLDKEPDNRAKLTDPQKVGQLLGSAYPLANYMAFTEAMSDNVSDKGGGTQHPTNRDPYFFEDVKDKEEDSPDNYWNECYKAIASANEALAACKSAANPADYQKQKGEALLARAYAHFMLVTLYAKPYDAATAASNPGIPYVTESETVVFKAYERKTVAYVYDMIEKDITEGLPLINDDVYTVAKYHFNRSAGNAFAARFYLYKKDYAKTVQYATASVPNFLPNLRPWNTTYQTYGINNLPSMYQRTTEPANLLMVTCPTRYNYGNRYATYQYALTSSKQTQILQTPLTVTGGSWSYILGTVGSQNNVAIPKLNYTDFAYLTPTSDIGNSSGTINLFTVEEVLFNKAEANTYLGNYDAAIADLNTFMSTRLTGVTPGSLPANRQITQPKVVAHYTGLTIKDALVNYILELKRADFVHEGMRWFDILRYNLPVTHQIQGNSGVVTGTITIAATDPRRQLKLPDEVKSSGITDLNR